MSDGNSEKAMEAAGAVVEEQADEAVELKLRAAQRMEALGICASGLVHDFNNALAVVLGQSRVLQGTLPSEQGEQLETVIASTQRAAALARQLLVLARRDASEVGALLLAPAIKESLKLLNAMTARRLVFRADLPAEPLAARIAPHEFHQILFNLALNASEAMGEGEVMLQLKHRGAATPDLSPLHGGQALRFPAGDLPRHAEGWTEMTLEDCGPGMSAETLQQACEPFYTTKDGGTGLGLTMVRAIVDECGGALVLANRPAGGVTARVFLPVARQKEVEAVGAPSSQCGRGEIVVVVDDMQEMVATVSLVLETYDYAPRQFLSAEELFAYLDGDERPAAILLDVAMPQVSGTATAARLHRDFPDIPVILMSGCAFDKAAEASIALGHARTFLQKPFENRELLATLQHALRPA